MKKQVRVSMNRTLQSQILFQMMLSYSIILSHCLKGSMPTLDTNKQKNSSWKATGKRLCLTWMLQSCHKAQAPKNVSLNYIV